MPGQPKIPLGDTESDYRGYEPANVPRLDLKRVKRDYDPCAPLANRDPHLFVSFDGSFLINNVQPDGNQATEAEP